MVNCIMGCFINHSILRSRSSSEIKTFKRNSSVLYLPYTTVTANHLLYTNSFPLFSYVFYVCFNSIFWAGGQRRKALLWWDGGSSYPVLR